MDGIIEQIKRFQSVQVKIKNNGNVFITVSNWYGVLNVIELAEVEALNPAKIGAMFRKKEFFFLVKNTFSDS